MSSRYLGGIVSATAPTPSASSASGVWTLKEAEYYQKAGNWPAGTGADPYFDNTTLLLHGDGTNGAQNNTFLDSSVNNFTLTRNGNTTQGSFDPYAGPGNWSNFYASTQSGWQTAASTVSSVLGSTFNSTATFTVEAWIYPVARHSGGGAVLGYLFGSMNLAGSAVDWSFGPDSNGNLVTFWYQGGNQVCKATSSTIPLNTWTHVALSVSSGAIKMFVNGVLQTTTGPTTITLASQTLSYVSSGGYLYAGTTWQGFNGYISNMRVVGKRALYTTNFTPSTTPLVATTDTTLLVNNKATITDSSAGNYVLTRTGSLALSKFSPFTLYQTTPASYSGYFSGTGGFLSLSASTAFGVGAGDFTIEYWAFYNTFASSPIGFDTRSTSGDITPSDYVTTGGNLVFYYNSANLLTSTNAAVLGRWNHIAWVRSGTTLTSYINGVASGSVTSSANFGTSQPLRIAGNITAVNFLNGSISNFRFTKGQALYTTGFTPSTSPLTTTSQGATAANVSLLTCQSTTFIDNSPNAFAITTNGNATPKVANPFTDTVTGPTPYSSAAYAGSMYFDGTGDYLLNTTAAAVDFGASDFTWESWIYAPAWNTLTNAAIIFEAAASNGSFLVYKDGSAASPSNRLAFGAYNSTNYTIMAGASVPTAQWFHLAISRNAGTTKSYVNGALVASTLDSNVYSVAGITVGARSGGTIPFNGYLAGTRAVKGVGLYPNAFVPPAAPLTAITNTSVLLNASNAGIFDNTTINDIETVGGAQVSTSVVKYGTGSIAYNGTNSYLSLKGGMGTYNGAAIAGSGLFFAGNTFTIEAWINTTTKVSTANYYSIILGDVNGASGTTMYWNVGLNTSGQANISWYDGTSKACAGSTVIADGVWTHIAFVSTAGTIQIYVNGVAETLSGSTTVTTPAGSVGLLVSGVDRQRYWAGYMDDLRVTNGVARYSANFTPPAGPFPNY